MSDSPELYQSKEKDLDWGNSIDSVPLARPEAKDLVGHDYREEEKSYNTAVEALLDANEGYIVGRMGNEVLRYNTDAHLLTISPTGGGKGTGLLIPNLLDHPGSALVIDIRGETVAKTATARMLQGQQIVVLDPYNLTKGRWGHDQYNPFDRISDNPQDRTVDDLIMRMTTAFMHDPKGRMSNEPIWDNATKNLISGLINLCVRYWPKHRRNLAEVLDVLHQTPDERRVFIQKLEALIEHDPEAQKDRKLKALLSLLTEAKKTTKITDNAIVQAQTLFNWVSNKAFENILGYSTFSFDDLAKGKTTVYLVVPDEFIENCASWVRVILESAVFSLPDIYSTKGVDTKSLPHSERVLFLLDELPAFGQLDIVSQGMATLRGRGVNLWLFIQNIAQLEATYGKEKARVIIGNAASLQVFGSNELEELEYFSRLVGEEFHDVQSVTLGSSETQGESQTTGQSHTVSNSESLTRTHGTADTTSTATAVNWSEAISEGVNSSQTTQSGGHSSFNIGFGSNHNQGSSYQRNMAGGGNSYGDNKSGGGSRQVGFTKGWNSSKSETRGHSRSETATKGGGTTETAGRSVNESESRTTQTGYSDTVNTSQTKNQSHSRNRSMTVKYERMKIETVRSLREKLSGRNQLLLVRGYHPFFAPRMSYFVKFLDKDRYMFPSFTVMADINAFKKIISHRLKADCPENISTLKRHIEIVKQFLPDDGKEIDWSRVDAFQLSFIFHTFFKTGFRSFVSEIRAFEECLLSEIEALDEVILSIMTLKTILEGNKVSEIDQDWKQFTAIVSSTQSVVAPIWKKYEKMSLKYSDLPIASKMDKMQFSQNFEWSSPNYENNHMWLVATYRPLVMKVLEEMNNAIFEIRTEISKMESLKHTIQDLCAKILDNWHLVEQVVAERQMMNKRSFIESQMR